VDFCKNSNEYITLYIDDKLDETTKSEFQKHVAECNQCADRLKEVSIISELCRESDEIKLPAEFSSSLHERLRSVSLKEKEKSRRLFIYNKRWIAGLSTAAVLVVTLLAYNLLPEMGGTKDSASMALNSGIQESVTAGSDSSSSSQAAQSDKSQLYQSESGIPQPAGGSAGSSNTGNSDTADKFEDRVPSGNKAKGKAAEKPFTAKTAPSTDKNEGNGNDSVYSMKMAQSTDSLQYFSNTAEMSLTNADDSSQNHEIEELAKLMKELGGQEVEINPDMAVLTSSGYVDYSISLDYFGRIQKDAAEKYNLQIKEKTPVKQEDITEEYNELTRQIDELNKKIDEAAKKSEDTSSMEEERDNLSQKMSEIAKNSGMITVRIYFTDK
jgi:hypothetical protein